MVLVRFHWVSGMNSTDGNAMEAFGWAGGPLQRAKAGKRFLATIVACQNGQKGRLHRFTML